MATVGSYKGTSFPSFTIGKNGATIFQGLSLPTIDFGKAGDLYIHINGSSSGLYQKSNSDWSTVTANFVAGPSSSTPNSIAVFGSSDGKSVIDGGLTIFPSGGTTFIQSASTPLGINASNVIFNNQIQVPNTGLKIADTNASHFLTISPGSNLTANRTLSIITGDSNRDLTLTGNASISGTNTGDQTITLTGHVTGSGTGSFATTIQPGVVTNAMLAGSIDLTTKVTSILPIANGGTNSNSQTTSGIAYFNGTSITTDSNLSYNTTLTGDSSTSNIFRVNGSLNSSNTNHAYGTRFDVASSGTSSWSQAAININLSSGYTGNSFTYGALVNNTASSSGVGGVGVTQANYGVYSQVTGATSGNRVGYGSWVSGSSSRNIGISSAAVTPENNALNIGVVALGLNTGTSSTQVGGYFGLRNSSPTFTSAALIADNGTTTSPIFIARDNTTTVFTIADGGDITATGSFTAANFSGSLTGTNTGDQTITLSGDISGTGTGSFSTTIGNNVVSYSKIQQAGSLKLLGNSTGGVANVAEIDFSTFLQSANNLSDLINSSNARDNLGVTIGQDVQAWDGSLDSISALDNTAGVIVKTGNDAFAKRTITGTTNRITVTNGDGQSANPTLDIGSDVVTLTALQTLSGKTINAGDNTISNLTTSMFAANVIDNDSSLSAQSSSRIPTQQAVYNFVWDSINNIDWKEAVVAATGAPGTLATDFENGDTLDTITLETGMRILIKNQVDASENGIYIVQASGAPIRANDANTGDELQAATVLVLSGDNYTNTVWTVTSVDIVLGVSDINFIQLSGTGGTVGAGYGLLLNGSNLDVNTTIIAEVASSLQVTNNLSDLDSVSDSRDNLGLGSLDTPSFVSITASGSSISVNSFALSVNATSAINQDVQTTASPTHAGLTLSNFSSAGLVHNNASGVLSSSLLVDGDITSNTITYSKIQQAGSLKLLGNSTGGTANVAEIDFSTFLQSANNLSEVNATTARTNLGLGSIATEAADAYLLVSNNLSDLNSASDGRENLELHIKTGNIYLSAGAIASIIAGGGTITLQAYALYPYLIDSINGLSTISGSVDVTISINGVVVVGLSSITANSTPANHSSSDDNTVVIGDKITLTLSNNSGADGLEFTLQGIQ